MQICPVGALTAKPYRFKARPWDLEQVETTCTTCSVGCRIVVQSSRDELLRYQGVDSDPVNWGWLCDQGRFGFEAVNSDDRLTRAARARAATSWRRPRGTRRSTRAAELISEAKAAGGAGSRSPCSAAPAAPTRTPTPGPSWPRTSSAPHVDAQLGDGLAGDRARLRRATIDEAAAASTVVLLGPDLKEELPVLFLRLRDAAQKRRSRIIELAPEAQRARRRTAWRTIEYQAGSIAEAVATRAGRRPDDRRRSSARATVVIVAGRANLAEHPPRASAMASLAALQHRAGRQGAAGAAPRQRRRRARSSGSRPGEGGMTRSASLRAAAAGKIELPRPARLPTRWPTSPTPTSPGGRSPARRASSPSTRSSPTSSAAADVVLAGRRRTARRRGTTTNLEGRVTHGRQKVTPRGTAGPTG